MRLTLCALALAGSLSAAALEERLAGAFAQVPRGGEAAVAVWDCRAGRWAAVAGDPGALRLASTTKLLVAAAALRELGPRFQFITRVYALGPVQAGTVPGLGVIGGGDPTLDEHFWAEDPENCFRQWAGRLRAAGIVRIAGDLLIDNRLFQGPARPATYPSEGGNLQRWFSAPASAFAFNDNCIDVRAVPTQPGAPCRIDLRPRSPRISVENATRTVAGSGDARFQVVRAAAANAVTVSGSYGKPTAWFPMAIHEDPDLLAGDALAAVLREAGIAFTGQVRLGAVDVRLGPLLIDHRSDLGPALNLMNQHSQNFYGEQLLRLVAVRKGQPGSIEAGTRAVMDSCAPLLGGEAATVRILDGSGLSYGNIASARGLCRLLASMDASPLGPLFAASLKNRPHAGLLGKVKTGTLATAACLAGFVEGPGGRLAFVVLLGQGRAEAWGWGSGLRDRVFELVAEAVR